MLYAAQSTRTFFVTSTTAGRRALLRSDRMAQLLVAPGLKSRGGPTLVGPQRAEQELGFAGCGKTRWMKGTGFLAAASFSPVRLNLQMNRLQPPRVLL